MDDKRNGVPSVPPDIGTPSNDSSQNNSSAAIIPQAALKNQGNAPASDKKKWSKKDCKVLSLDNKVHSLAIKIYEEQLKYGWTYVCNEIHATDPKDFQVIAIQHDLDVYAEDNCFWRPAIEKPHIHIIFRCMDRKKRIRVRNVLDALGIVFRPGLDDDLWKNHGVETVGNFPGYAAYLTHETEDAIRDGKTRYPLDELVSNLTIEEIKEVRQGYLRVSQNTKMTTAAWVELDQQAYNIGREFGDFDAWYGELPFVARSGARIKTIRESYDRGVREAVNEDPKVLRTCIFIQGGPNRGKTYAAKAALELPGRLVLTVEGGGTGKFDKLRAYTQAILVSDDTCPNLLNMADDYKCQAYRRGSNNPYWTGAYFVVTSNLSFPEWLDSCGIKIYKKKRTPYGMVDDEKQYSDHYNAMESRFFVCHLVDAEGNSPQRLVLDSPATRGTFEEQKERLERFLKFKLKFNATIAEYVPGPALDYDAVIDPESLPLDRACRAHPGYAFSKLNYFSKWFWETDRSPWRAAKKTAVDKLTFLKGISDAEIRAAANQCQYYDVLEQIGPGLLRGALEASARDYGPDDDIMFTDNF